MKLSKLTQWFASANGVSFTLFIGVLFLFSNYQSVLFRVSPENDMAFQYPYFVRVLIAHIDSFFFSFATITIIFQCKNEFYKIVFCVFEAVMLSLNLTAKQYKENDFYIAIYIAVFSGFTFYILGTLAKMHLKENEKANLPTNLPINSENVNAIMNESEKYVFLRKYAKVVDALNSGLSIAQTAKKTKVSESTIKKVRQILKELEFAIVPTNT
jgi:hypothetical protein